MNNINVIGRLTRNVEMKRTSTGKDMARFFIAVPRRAVKNAENSTPYFFRVVVFNAYARSCYSYLKQGSKIAVHGYLRQDVYVEKETGNKRSYYEIVASSIDFLGNPKENTAGTAEHIMSTEDEELPCDEADSEDELVIADDDAEL